MGIPTFFGWLTKKYPRIITERIEEENETNALAHENISLDKINLNSNETKFDNLYLDLNGIIHQAANPTDRPLPENEDEIMSSIFDNIDKIFAKVQPRKLLYIAIDGVAPRAKMNQQRSRRFKAAKNISESAEAIFDTNSITPGTPFMHKLSHCINYYIYEKLNNNLSWKDLMVIFSDSNVPGEGEHKIMDYIRRQRANPDHDPNTHHVLYGSDADLIMLALATHEPNFTIIREISNDKKVNFEKLENSKHTPIIKGYLFLSISILREYLNKELYLPNLPFKFDIERAIDDWVFLCFLVGNDFLPNSPSIEIRENIIDRLVSFYKNMLKNKGEWLTNMGNLNLNMLQYILNDLSKVEQKIFKNRHENKLKFEKKQIENASKSKVENDSIEKTNDTVLSKEKEIENSDANDQIRLWEDGWKQRYYLEKFGINIIEKNSFTNEIARDYIIGLQWILKYYSQGLPSWNWYYPHHYAPFVSDFVNIIDFKPNFNLSKPFTPFEQQMAIFPAANCYLLPEAWRNLMTDKNSEIISFYPKDFQIDLNGKKFEWQGVALLPFVDENLLKSNLKPVEDTLTLEEKKRNALGNDRFFVGRFHKLYDLFKEIYTNNNLATSLELKTSQSGGIAGKIWFDESAVLENEIFKSPIINPNYSDINNNKVLNVKYHLPIYPDEYCFKSSILDRTVLSTILESEDFKQDKSGSYKPLNANLKNGYWFIEKDQKISSSPV